MGAKAGNQNAAKDPADKVGSVLHIRVTQAEKAAWVKAAKGQKLATWVREQLNRAAQI